MKEIVTIDGKQFELVTEYPLTEQQRQQTISDIRRQSGCSSCNKTQSLNGSIQTLATDCIDATVVAPALVSVAGLRISGPPGSEDDCASGCKPITCSDNTCTGVSRDVTVTLANAGDIDANMYVRVQVRESPTGTVRATYTTSTSVTIPARATPTSPDGTVDVPFTGVALARGSNNVCADFQLVAYT